MNHKEQTKIVTHTGEDSQPARIYFQVFKHKTLLGVFKKLRCVRYELQNPDGRYGWRWFYDQEAKKLKFQPHIPHFNNVLSKKYENDSICFPKLSQNTRLKKVLFRIKKLFPEIRKNFH
ncbi:hypothetical protein [Gloeothece verrucosa]|uniref:Uncharacterized protein n=1 Tax=Gloeothece verrucosa (strain PCC 7822) TaxID=497965 RepID=E0UM63_GLOV7|nr:hypothetical protein [Gloeothece verrucosa]ADN18043.1 hypothetical protein Cyan7822_6242 [Gloeothece verrucosa PCC 7822]